MRGTSTVHTIFLSSHRHRIVFDSRARSMFFRTFFFFTLHPSLILLSCALLCKCVWCRLFACFLFQKGGFLCFFGKIISLVKFSFSLLRSAFLICCYDWPSKRTIIRKLQVRFCSGLKNFLFFMFLLENGIDKENVRNWKVWRLNFLLKGIFRTNLLDKI